ncbi:hypothetical protein, partial [Arsenophonus sp.]|uniref:hypothetical protein n=1 Tax=Arsenophonus sp. TaxID=1872640 RepID=UPI002859F3F1
YLEEKFCGSGNIHTPDYNGRRLLRTAIYLQRLSSRRRRATVLKTVLGEEEVVMVEELVQKERGIAEGIALLHDTILI